MRDVVDTVMDYVSPRPSCLHRLPRGSDGRIAWGPCRREALLRPRPLFIVECDDLHVTVARWFHWDDMCSKLTNALLSLPGAALRRRMGVQPQSRRRREVHRSTLSYLVRTVRQDGGGERHPPRRGGCHRGSRHLGWSTCQAKFSRGFLVESDASLLDRLQDPNPWQCWGDRAFESDYTFVAILPLHPYVWDWTCRGNRAQQLASPSHPRTTSAGFAFRAHDRVIVVFVPDQLSIWDIMEDKFKSVVNLRPK